MPGLRPGRIVDFVDAQGKHIPAMVTGVFEGGGGEMNYVSLTIHEPFVDPRALPFSVPYSEDHALLTWHWLEQA